MGTVTWVSGMPKSRRHFEDVTRLLCRSDFEPNQILDLDPLEMDPTYPSRAGIYQSMGPVPDCGAGAWAESESRLAAVHALANIGPVVDESPMKHVNIEIDRNTGIFVRCADSGAAQKAEGLLKSAGVRDVSIRLAVGR